MLSTYHAISKRIKEPFVRSMTDIHHIPENQPSLLDSSSKSKTNAISICTNNLFLSKLCLSKWRKLGKKGGGGLVALVATCPGCFGRLWVPGGLSGHCGHSGLGVHSGPGSMVDSMALVTLVLLEATVSLVAKDTTVELSELKWRKNCYCKIIKAKIILHNSIAIQNLTYYDIKLITTLHLQANKQTTNKTKTIFTGVFMIQSSEDTIVEFLNL